MCEFHTCAVLSQTMLILAQPLTRRAPGDGLTSTHVDRLAQQQPSAPLGLGAESQATSAVMLVLGIEGSANKVGVGIVREDGEILANPRRTCAPACRHRRQPP